MPLCSDECGREATLYCAKCELYWCEVCSTEAHARRAFKSHAPVRIPEGQQRSRLQQFGQQHHGPRDAASASSVAGRMTRWFSRQCHLPSLPSSSSSSLPLSPRPVLIVVDWSSFVWVVRRSSLGMFVRTLAQLAHDLGYTPVTKLLFLMDPLVHGPSPRAKEVAAEMAAFFIEQMQLAWDDGTTPRLLEHKIQELRQRTDGFDSGSLTIFASSRPQLFRTLLDGWLIQGRQLALVHGHGKLAHSLPAPQLQTDDHRPTNLYQFGLEVATKLRSEAQSSAPDAISPYLHRTLSTAFALITSTWPSDPPSQPGAPLALATTLGQHLSQLVGTYCVWDLPPWHESYEQPPTAGVEARVLPEHGCPLWNAERPCASSTCPQPHHCQACGQSHRLTHCPVNSFIGPVQSLSTRRDLNHADLLAFMRWYGDTYALLRFHSCFHMWKLPLREQLTLAKLLLLPSAVLQQSPDGLLPSEALVYIDWQNIKVPIYAIEAFMTGLCQFAQGGRPGVRSVRAIHVLLDRDKKGDVGDALDRLARTGTLPIHVVHVEARKVQAVDSRLTLMLRTEPRAVVPGKQQADLVCVVSGDSDFSPDMSRLVLLGHRVLLVYNTQARPSFKQNALWEAAVDFMDLPELASYRAAQIKLRADRKRMAQSALQQGINTRVSSMVLYGGDIRARLPGLNGACLDYEGRALLLTDEAQNRLWRFVFLADELTAFDKKTKANIRTAHEKQTKESLKGTLELLAGELSHPECVVVDPSHRLVFVCDAGHNRIAVLDRDTQHMRTLLPSESSRVSCRPRPRHLFLDTTRQRLWITDISTQQLGFYDLRHLSMLDGSTAIAPYRTVPLPSTSSQPTSKCLAANQSDLVYCDQGQRAFYLLTETKQSRQVSASASVDNAQNDGVVFVFSLLYEWETTGSNAPLPSYHSLQLDRDGSYLFTDSTSNTIKRLVSLRDSVDSTDVDSNHWEVRLVAGKGPGGYADGAAHEARFQFPATLVVDPHEVGSVFIVDYGNKALRKLHVAHESEEGDSNSNGPPAHGYSRNLQARAEVARSRWKTRPCKPFQSGECRFQAESDKCGFIHECVQCGGPHGEKDCPHKLLQYEHPYLTFTSADGGDSSIRAKELIYSCKICSESCGALTLAAQHVESEAHRDKQRQLLQLGHNIGSVDAVHFPHQHECATPMHIPSPSPSSPSANFVPVDQMVSTGHSSPVTSREESSSCSSPPLLNNIHPPSRTSTAAGSLARASSSSSFHCDICNMCFNSRSQMEQHAQGRSHRTRSARLAAGMPLSIPRRSPGSSPTRSFDSNLLCPCCTEAFRALADSPDRRPRVLTCGHSLCSNCTGNLDHCPMCRVPFDASALPINFHLVHIIESSVQRALEHERRRTEVERQNVEQHVAFQSTYPFMQYEAARSTSKEPRYTCTICDVMAGPIHRALAHANTSEHKAKQQQMPAPLLSHTHTANTSSRLAAQR